MTQGARLIGSLTAVRALAGGIEEGILSGHVHGNGVPVAGKEGLCSLTNTKRLCLAAYSPGSPHAQF